MDVHPTLRLSDLQTEAVNASLLEVREILNLFLNVQIRNNKMLWKPLKSVNNFEIFNTN